MAGLLKGLSKAYLNLSTLIEGLLKAYLSLLKQQLIQAYSGLFKLKLGFHDRLPKVQHPAGVVDEARRSVAKILKESNFCCLDVNMCTDMPKKIMMMFAAEVAVVAASGQVPLNLFGFLLLWRSEMPAETQLVEGMNSILVIVESN